MSKINRVQTPAPKHLGDYFVQRQERGIDGLPMMSVTMNDSLVLRDDLEMKMTSALLPEQHLLVKKGDIAYNMMRMWQGACGLAEADGIVSPAYVVLEPLPGMDSKFAYHWFKTSRMIYLFWAFSHGLTEDRLRLYFDEFARIPVAPPSLEQQRRIVAVLDCWDEAIAGYESLRAAHVERRSWFRNELLTGNTRLKGHTGEWTELYLHQILEEHGLQSSGVEAVFSVSVRKGLINQTEHLGRSYAAKETAHYNRVLPGDIVYTKSPTGEFPFGIIKQSTITEDVIVSPLYGVFSPNSLAVGTILDAYFESPIATKNYLNPLVQKGAKNTMAISNRRFLQGTLYLPVTAREQEALAEVLRASKAELLELEAHIKALRAQKRGLVQMLLTDGRQLDARFDLPIAPAPRTLSRDEFTYPGKAASR